MEASSTLKSCLLGITENEMLLVCSSDGNPDHSQYAPISDPEYIVITSFEEAAAACWAYIEMWEIGGGNWIGGQIYNHTGKLIAEVSYNGRVWEEGYSFDKENIEIAINKETVQKLKVHYMGKYIDLLNEHCKIIGINLNLTL